MAETPTVHQALSAVMADVQAVRKDSKNQQQRFNFRGIDAVMNAVGPALRKQKVVILPVDTEVHRSEKTLASGKAATEVVLKVTYRVYGPGGDHIDGTVAAEAMDMGDKAIAKAHSVAYRTFLLQALTIPTDDPDPDESTYERAPSQGNRGLPTEQGVPNGTGASQHTAAEQCTMILDAFCKAHDLNSKEVKESYRQAGGKAVPDMLKAWLTSNYQMGVTQ